MAYKLGCLPKKFSAKTLHFPKYVLADAPLPPYTSKSYYEYLIAADAWLMLGNDQYGDCATAGPAHEVMNRTAHRGKGMMVTPTMADIFAMYAAICPGFSPGPPPVNDNGAAITDALNYMLLTGLAGEKIDGWAEIDPSNVENIKRGIHIFGSVNIGVNLPQSAMDQTNAGQAWDVVADDGGILGGHCVVLMGYGADGCTAITWGQLQQITWAWFAAYCQEAYVELASDWIAASGLAPNSLDMATLTADLALLKS